MNLRLFATLLLALVALTASSSSAAADDLADHRTCTYCGMDRKAYGYSRMLLRYEDGSSAGVCSLHCAVTEMNTAGKRRQAILVADRTTRRLIPAETAAWVIGGRKRGVMTHRPKWAFASKTAAEAFITANGGAIADWATALAAARDDAGQSVTR